MYQKYFGFKERPFQLVPNPAYLFLSRSHEEAMAHLSYAVSEGDGFIAIIGEAGTGKTTLCRAFIDGVGNSCEIAYIFNPKLSAVELLKSICDEFAVPTNDTETTKHLIDLLNRFLLDKKAEGRQVMLIIDESQNLSREVLEQVRLLSNLETNTEKLIQIVLVGQPEMDDLLGHRNLRQLSQRITLSCRLTPLTLQETEQYIQHRLRIAARKESVVFTPRAYRKIHAFSKGLPRLIHIACDRSLLVAYVANREKITGKIVDSAVLELISRKDLGLLRKIEKRKTVLLGALLGFAMILLLVLNPMDNDVSSVTNSQTTFKVPSPGQAKTFHAPLDSSTGETPAVSEAAQSPEAAPSQPPVETSPVRVADDTRPSGLATFLAGLTSSESKETALSSAISLWGKPLPIKQYPDKQLVDPGTYFSLTAKENGFLIYQSKTGIDEIYRLNLPAIFEFRLPGALRSVFLTLSEASQSTLAFLVDTDGSRTYVLRDDVMELWTGTAYVPWINFYEYGGVIPISGSEMDVVTLKHILKEIGYSDVTSDAVYDAAAKSAVKQIQEKYGVPVDGLVGPVTKMLLYNELQGLDIPHILKSDTSLAATE